MKVNYQPVEMKIKPKFHYLPQTMLRHVKKEFQNNFENVQKMTFSTIEMVKNSRNDHATKA